MAAFWAEVWREPEGTPGLDNRPAISSMNASEWVFRREARFEPRPPFTDSTREKPDPNLPLGKRPEACYQITNNEPNIDKWPLLAVQIIFQKSEKKTCHPLNC